MLHVFLYVFLLQLIRVDLLLYFLQAVDCCVELTDGYAAHGLCHVLEVRTHQANSGSYN